MMSFATLRDPMAVAVDGVAPGNGFDGGGSLFLGDGWGRPEGTGDKSDWGSMAWVVGREAVVHLLLPPGSRLDFFARCLPYPWSTGAPQQTMELLIGDRVVGRVELIRDWQDVRMPLPADLPEGRLLTLRLRFAYALRPLDLGDSDPRSLAAAFTQLAVVPRAVQDPKQFLEAHVIDPQTGKVTLPASGGLRLPVPPASRIRLQLREFRSNCRGCELSLELAGPSEAPQSLRLHTQQETQTAEVTFDTGARGIHNLWIRASTLLPSSRGRVGFVLGPASVETRRGAWWKWWGDAGSTPSPNVFLYVIDTFRADTLSPYGGRPDIAPRMNAFAKEAATYVQARAPSSWTLPSVVSLLTGLYPDRHGVMEGKLQYDPARQPALQQLLRGRGYRTVGISHSFIVSKAYGVDAGFGGFYLTDHLNGWKLRSQEARGLLASWLSQRTDGAPIFAYLHTVDPHSPYSPPAEFVAAAERKPERPFMEDGLPDLLIARGKATDRAEIAHLRALYDGEVRFADQEFGRFVDLLKWLGLYDQSFVILAGDHGEEFAEHGGFEHGKTVFEEVLRVPLLVKYPGGRWAGQRIGVAVNLVDVAPTVLAGLGAPLAAFDGNVLPGPGASPRRPVYFEVAPAHDPDSKEIPVDLRGLVAGDVKCIENRAGVDHSGQPAPRLQAFNVAADPGESRPLAQDAGETARCRQLLDDWSRVRARKVSEQRSRREATPETLDRLRALGYIR